MGELIALNMLSAGLKKLVTTHPSESRAEESSVRLDCHMGVFEDIIVEHYKSVIAASPSFTDRLSEAQLWSTISRQILNQLGPITKSW